MANEERSKFNAGVVSQHVHSRECFLAAIFNDSKYLVENENRKSQQI